MRITKNRENILEDILYLLEIKYTKDYLHKLFNEHPYKYSMFGLSKMLSHYKIENIGVKIEKENFEKIETPFIAHIKGDFVAVEKITDTEVTYYWRKEKLCIPIEKFKEIWSGATLLVEANKNTKEPNYKKNRKKEIIKDTQLFLLGAGIILLILLTLIQNKSLFDIGLFIQLILNVIGIYIGYLLILKQMNIKSSYADKICSLFSRSSCNDVLQSPAAKFMGVIGWSELGLSYFLPNCFLILFTPHLFPYFVILNVFSLLYSFWSIWYQKAKAKQWCSLCLIVQFIFCSMFFVNLFLKFPLSLDVSFISLISIILIYSLPFLVINLVLPTMVGKKKIEKITQEFNSLRMNETLFLTTLKKSSRYDVNKENSKIYFGNPRAKILITVFTNPHCEPCAGMHQRIENTISNAGDKFCIQYMLSSFDEDLKKSNHFLLAANKYMSADDRDKVYSEWFTSGKYNPNSFFEKYDLPIDKLIEEESHVHEKWKEKTKLTATPTILFNGYELPLNYKIEDIVYFSDLDVNYI